MIAIMVAFFLTTSTIKLPQGYTEPLMHDFARRNPDFLSLAAQHVGSAFLDVTPALMETLEDINTRGNNLISYRTDPEAWGEADLWDFPCSVEGHLYDDCDGYALWKLRAAIQAGIPSNSLMLFGTFVETGERHMVLGVMTDRGILILDSRQETVMSTEELFRRGYNFYEHSSTADNLDRPWYPIAVTRKIPVMQSSGESGGVERKITPLCRPRPFKW